MYSSTWNLRFADKSQAFQTWEDMQIQVLAKYKYDIGKEILDGETVTS